MSTPPIPHGCDNVCRYCKTGYTYLQAAGAFKAATSYLRMVHGSPWRTFCRPVCLRRHRLQHRPVPVPA